MRNTSSKRMWRIIYLLTGLACLAMFESSAFAQLTMERSGPPACSNTDKLAITSFVINPSSPFVRGSVQIVMKITNKCPSGTASLNVPWNIKKDSTTLSSGTVTIDPGATKEVSAPWTATAGTFNFWGNADPEKRISESERNNNTTSDNSVTTLDWKILTLTSGGTFPANPESPTGPCYLKNNQMNDSFGGQIQTVLSCTGSVTGLKANPEYFKGLTLKNGWVVDTATVRDDAVIAGSGRGGWGWRTQPASGSNNPYARIHVWVDANTAFQYYLTVKIKGPAHLSPF